MQAEKNKKVKSGSLYTILIIYLVITISLLFYTSCSQKRYVDPFTLLQGTWKTEKGIFITVRNISDDEAEAVIELAPGYGGEDLKTGKVLISSIKPEMSGGYSGLFEIPGGLEAVKVEISVIRRNTMLIISRDKRIKGKRMIWSRMME